MRFVLVANNPRASLSNIRSTDALVQFNHAEHFETLARHAGPRLFVWRKAMGGSVSGWHGADPARDYGGDLHVVLGHDARVEFECERRGWPYRAWRVEPPRYPVGIPSTGFWALYVLWRLGADVALCGFTHDNTWPGHNWQYEREWTDAHGIARI